MIGSMSSGLRIQRCAIFNSSRLRLSRICAEKEYVDKVGVATDNDTIVKNFVAKLGKC